ncbi:MAG: GNAT family N-acetyltransferase [Rhodospirillales bacterium]|nr:GNAT family N-acetyltransferase [Rhodospirillales bacterium]
MNDLERYGDLTLDGYRPGAVGRIVTLHMDYYASAWNFGLPFETSVAGELASFFEGFDPKRDLFIGAYDPASILQGAIAVGAAGDDLARMRWFIIDRGYRGKGLGRALMDRAIDFARQAGFVSLYLTTFRGLEAARHLYETSGFKLVSESTDDRWHGGVTEQRFDLALR